MYKKCLFYLLDYPTPHSSYLRLKTDFFKSCLIKFLPTLIIPGILHPDFLSIITLDDQKVFPLASRVPFGFPTINHQKIQHFILSQLCLAFSEGH